MLSFEKLGPYCHYVLFYMNPKTCKFYLIPHMMTFVALKES